jgi:ATP-binding cassette, subfamily B, multidrug efflux pump
MLRWFESRIDPFASKTINQPPGLLWAFYWYFIEPIWPAFALLVFLDFLAALTEVALASFVAILIDLMKATESPAAFIGDHASLLIAMGLFVIVVRPTLVFGYELVKSQVLSPPFQTRARWQTHRYMLRQSLGFFQNDFAGRIANKLMQTAPAMRDSIVMLSDAAIFVAVQWLSSLVLFWAVDTVLVIPLLLWLAAYGGTLYFFVPRIRARSTEASEARSLLLGRIVDSYTNILTVKLFAHAERERCICPRRVRGADRQASVLCKAHDGNDRAFVPHERAAHRRNYGPRVVALEPRRCHAWVDRARHGACAAHYANGGMGVESGDQYLRKHWRCAGGNESYFAASRCHR